MSHRTRALPRNPVRSGRFQAGARDAVRWAMSRATLIVLLLAIAGCVGRRAGAGNGVGERGPLIWRGDGDDVAIDVVNGVVSAGLVAVTYDEPDGPLCTPETLDPPHTCPAKAVEGAR
jgi:hypothetical protein